MKACPECGSNKVYRYKKEIDAGGGYGPDLLPKLNPRFLGFAKFLPVVCKECGLIRYYLSEESREKLGSSEHWELND
jgi:predicted nucleic-acid-binding Zn-ribbon protein